MSIDTEMPYMEVFLNIYKEKYEKEFGEISEFLKTAFLLFPRLHFLPEGEKRYGNNYKTDGSLPVFFKEVDSNPEYPIICSQPSFILIMLQVLKLGNGVDSVLEIGSGAGWMCAIISRLSKKVYGVDIFEDVCSFAKTKMSELGVSNVEITKVNRGEQLGLPNKAPFERIIASCGVKMELLPTITSQLSNDGIAILPVIYPDTPQEKPAKDSLKNLASCDFIVICQDLAEKKPGDCVLCEVTQKSIEEIIDCRFSPCL